MGKFININTKIPPLPRRLRPGFYGLTVIFYDTPKRNTQIPEQRSWVADSYTEALRNSCKNGCETYPLRNARAGASRVGCAGCERDTPARLYSRHARAYIIFSACAFLWLSRCSEFFTVAADSEK